MSDLLEIQINNYEGPLDLLIHLVHKNEMNIFDVPISVITEQFINEIKLMQSMDMEIAAEFINMASYLIYLKSRSLLPRGTTAGEEISVEEEGFNLAQMIIELSYCKDLAISLQNRYTKTSRYLLRRDPILIPIQSEGMSPIREENPYKIADAFFGLTVVPEENKVIITSTKKKSDDIKEKTAEILMGRNQTLWSYLEEIFKESFERAIVFSTILTLSKQKCIKSLQDGNFTDILVKKLKEPDTKDIDNTNC